MIFISIMILIVAIALHSLSPVLLTRISAIVFIYAGVLSLNALDIQSIGSGIGIYSGLFHVTTVSQLIDTFIFFIGSLILVSWPTPFGPFLAGATATVAPSFSKEQSSAIASSKAIEESIGLRPQAVTDWRKENRLIQGGGTKLNNACAKQAKHEYSLIVLFSTLGASLLISSADLISMYLSIELQSFGVYILSTLYRNSESATSAGLKYFLLGSLSSCLILLGTGLIYSFTGLTNLESIYSLVSVSDCEAEALSLSASEAMLGVPSASTPSCGSYATNITQGLNLGLIIIIIGFLFKISAAPLHHWAPDVYDDSPTIVTIWLTIMPKISIIIFLLELQTQLGIIGNNLSIISIVELLDSYQVPLLPLPPHCASEAIASSNAIEACVSYRAPGGDGPYSFLASPACEAGNRVVYTAASSFAPPLVVQQGSGVEWSVASAATVLKNLLLISSLLSLIIGTIVGLAQSKIKRLLSYSTISHVGFILLALAINTEQSIDSLIFYIIQYSLTNLNTFLIIIAFGYIIPTIRSVASLEAIASRGNKDSAAPSFGRFAGSEYSLLASPAKQVRGPKVGTELDIKFISELKGQFFSNPLLSISLTVCLFSMAGIPPLLGFFSKQFVLYSAIQSGYYFMSIVAIIVSVISASYYLKIIKVLLAKATLPNTAGLSNSTTPLSPSFSKASPAMAGQVCEASEASKGVALASEAIGISNFHSFLISTLTLSILLFVLKPSIILNSTQLLSLSLFYY